MRDLPLDKLNTIAEVFVTVPLMAYAIMEATMSNDPVPDAVAEQISDDAEIITHHMAAMLDILDEHSPGFRNLVKNAERAAQRRAARMIAEADLSPKH